MAVVLVVCAAAIAGIGFGWRAYRVVTRLAETARRTRRHAEQGDAQAQVDLAHMYYYGIGVPKSYAEAAEWERKAANQGNAKGQYHLGYLYYYGRGVPLDRATALEWERKAADQGLADAQASIGSRYQSGDGVPKDYAEALRWYGKAADQGEAAAEDGLGTQYEQGEGVPKDFAEAARWYRKAADQGYAYAEYNLGKLYYYGSGVPQDRVEANRWFAKAAAQGNDEANRVLSLRLKPLNKLNLALDFLVGAWLTFNFVSFNYLVPHKSLRDVRQRVTTSTGLLWLFYGGLSWYGFAHHKIRSLSLYPNTFTWLRQGLGAAAIAALVYTMWFTSRQSETEENAGSGEAQQQS